MWIYQKNRRNSKILIIFFPNTQYLQTFKKYLFIWLRNLSEISMKKGSKEKGRKEKVVEKEKVIWGGWDKGEENKNSTLQL